ncbi:hypothetical protein ABDB87_06480 [Uliginosibacterium paludis]
MKTPDRCALQHRPCLFPVLILMQVFDFPLAEARLELALLQAEANVTCSADFYLWLRGSGLPAEVSARLFSLAECSCQVEGRAVALGKIVAIKLAEFVRAHPDLPGFTALVAAVSCLVRRLPVAAALLQPLMQTLADATAGHASPAGEATPELLAGRFFQPLIDLLNTLCPHPVASV